MAITIKGTLVRVLHFLVALLGTTVLCSIAASQFNLTRLTEMGVLVPLSDRLAVTAHDIWNMGPLYGALIGAALVIAFPVAGILARWLPRQRAGLYVLAGAVAVAVLLLAMDRAFGITLIAAARSGAGFVSQMIGGAIGGWIFARLTRKVGQA